MVDANADTIAPIRQIKNAARSGNPHVCNRIPEPLDGVLVLQKSDVRDDSADEEHGAPADLVDGAAGGGREDQGEKYRDGQCGESDVEVEHQGAECKRRQSEQGESALEVECSSRAERSHPRTCRHPSSCRRNPNR